MAANEIRCTSEWCFTAQIEEIASILEDTDSICHWWPRAYLVSRTLDQGDDEGRGRHVRLVTRGRLPIQFEWELIMVERDYPSRICYQTMGHFVGRCEWILTQKGDVAHVQFDWHVRAEHPAVKRLSYALKPLFVWNHRCAMEDGQQCLCAELKRRRRINLLSPGSAARVRADTLN